MPSVRRNRMKWFVIAMDKEAAPVVAAMSAVKERKICGKRVIYGTLSGEQVAVIVCGVGKVNAACGAQMALDNGATSIINIGFAGGLNNSLEIGKIYSISAAVQYDFDLTQLNGGVIGTLDECSENYLPLATSSPFPSKKLATGDRFNDSKEDFRLLTEVLGADIRDMEGGAIAQACMHGGAKFYSFKVISDLAGSGSTTEQFLNNLEICANSVKDNIVKIIDALNGGSR